MPTVVPRAIGAALAAALFLSTGNVVLGQSESAPAIIRFNRSYLKVWIGMHDALGSAALKAASNHTRQLSWWGRGCRRKTQCWRRAASPTSSKNGDLK
jgi:hypothetical protein